MHTSSPQRPQMPSHGWKILFFNLKLLQSEDAKPGAMEGQMYIYQSKRDQQPVYCCLMIISKLIHYYTTQTIFSQGVPENLCYLVHPFKHFFDLSHTSNLLKTLKILMHRVYLCINIKISIEGA